MRKKPVLVLFVSLAAVAVCLGVAVHLLLAASGFGWLGWCLDAAIFALVIIVSFGCFRRNSAIFARVINNRSQTAGTLPVILDVMREKGLRPVTISELAATTRARPRRSRRRGLFIVGILAILVGILLYRLGLEPVEDSLRVFAGLNFALVGAAILANLVSIALKSAVWKESLECVPSRPPVRYRQVVAAVFIGFLMNSVLAARMGELGRAVVLRRRIERDSGVRVPLGTIAGTVVSVNLVLSATLVALLVTMTFTVANLPQPVVKGITILVVAVIALIVAVLLIELFTRWRHHRNPGLLDEEHKARWRRILHRGERIVHELSQGQRLFSNPRRAATAIAAGLVSWIANLLAIWFTALAFGIHDNAFAAAVVVFAVSNLVGIVQITPGNVGLFQVAIALALAQSYGIDHALGISFGIGLQAIEVGLGAGLGLVFLSLEGLSLAEVRHDMHRDEPPEAAG